MNIKLFHIINDKCSEHSFCNTLNIILQNRHCILDVCISAVERLHRQNIFPIVLLLRFKSAKQIKEIKDSRYSVDKISAKAAKEMYEHALKLEVDYRQLISGKCIKYITYSFLNKFV